MVSLLYYEYFPGEQSPNEGSISTPNDCSLGYLRQDLDFEEGRTVQQEAELAFKEIKELEKRTP